MSNVFKQLLTEIHKYNHIETSETAFVSNDDLQYYVILHNQYTVNGRLIKIQGPLEFGVYYFNSHLFLLDIDIKEDEYIEYIRDTYLIHVVRFNGSRHCLKIFNIYNLDFDRTSNEVHTGELQYTVNSEVDKILVTGNTDIIIDTGSTQSPDYPGVLKSTTTIVLNSSSIINKDLKDEFTIRLKNGLKSLPCGVGDILIVDNINNKSYRINKVGRLLITGNEGTGWHHVPELHSNGASGYSTYFSNINVCNVSDELDIICNYFPTITYSEMMSDGGLLYAISNSNDSNNNGIYIRVPNSIADNDDGVFNDWIKEMNSSGTFIIAEYHLKKYIWEEISLDKYDFKTYYGGTKIETTENVNKISLFCKTFGINYENMIPTGTIITTLNKDTADPDKYIYGAGQSIYKYNPNTIGLYSVIDDYYGSYENNEIMPDQDKYGTDWSNFDPDSIDYQFYMSSSNPKIDTRGYLPIGGIIQWYNKDIIPDGFLVYEGQEVSRTEYKDLFDVLGTSYGEGDGSTTFNLPNQNVNEESMSQEEIDSIGFIYLICYKQETSIPIGGCVQWCGNYEMIPTGFVQADGGSVSKLDYSDLYELFGNTYGETEDKFGLPNQNMYDLELPNDFVLENFSFIIKAL